MDRITKVQEVSSFIKKFDWKRWNEVVLRLTIIGIRYIKSQCHHFFKWRLDDLALISEQLKLTKGVPINFKTFYGTKFTNMLKRNDNKEFNKYNYNYSNSSIKNEVKDKGNYNNKYNNNSNYKSKSVIRDREIRDYNYGAKNWKNNGKPKETESQKNIEQKDDINKYPKSNEDENGEKNKNNNRNKILSLNNLNSNNDINIVVSDFPFSEKILIQNDEDKNNESEDKDNTQENKLEIKKIKSSNMDLMNNFEENNNMLNKSCALNDSFEYNNNINVKKGNKYLLNRIKMSKEMKPTSKSQIGGWNDFITQLRKINHSKDKNSELTRRQSFPVYPINIYDSNKTSFIHDKNQKYNYKNSFKAKNNFDSIREENINSYNCKTKDKQKNNLCFVNYHFNDLDNIQTAVKKPFDTDTTIEANNNYYNNKIDDFVGHKKSNYNKYLKNQNYKNKYHNSISIDSSQGRINNSNYIENINLKSPDKENKNIENVEEFNTDRYFCHYFYDGNKKLN